MSEWRGLIGIIALCAIAVALSHDRGKIHWRQLLGGLAIQAVIAFFVFRVQAVQNGLGVLSSMVNSLQAATKEGTTFLLGYLGGGPLPFDAHGDTFILLFQALPLVIVMSALSSVLFYWRVLPFIIGLISKVLERTLNIGGALGLGAAANIFVGLDTAPLLIRPHLVHFSSAELFAFMTVSMGTVAGTVMVLYAKILAPILPNGVAHIVAASLINVPAGLTIARIIRPDIGKPTHGNIDFGSQPHGTMDALARGAIDGMQLLLNIAAMLLALVAIVHLVNNAMQSVFTDLGHPVTLQSLLGYVFMPIVWLMGVPWEQAHTAGALLGTKTVLNELISYTDLSQLAPSALDARSRFIVIYSMCSFANLSSLGVLIGVMGTLLPDRRAEVARLAGWTLISATLATLMTGTLAGLFFVG